MEKIKVFSTFSGYGGCEFAFKKANIPFEVVGYSEINKFAIQCYEQNHSDIKNYGSISEIDPEDLPDFDLLTGGFPCQDVSIAGKRDLSKGRTLLIEHIFRIVAVKKPEYLLLENVKGLLSMTELWDSIRYTLKNLGYGVAYKVLNSKEHGIPQNRERIWIVCKYGGWDFMEFMFPNKEPLKIFVKDILEDNVDKKYYLSKKAIKRLIREEGFTSKITESIASCLTTAEMKVGRGMNLIADYRSDEGLRIRKDGCSPCLNARARQDMYGQPVVIGELKQFCKKRSNDTPKEINQYLKDNKGKYTINEIADYLNLPKTQVEHYFRIDKSRAIPSPTLWLKLKEILGFDCTFDKNVTEIYEKEITFEQTRRVYDSRGCSPTLNTIKEPMIILHSLFPRSSESGKGGTGHLSKEDGTTYCVDTGNCQAIEICSPVLTPDRLEKRQNGRRFKTDGEPMFTLNTQDRHGIYNGSTIRRLTPKECFRLMGFLNDEINVKGISDSQCYKLAGNGWEINVVSKILKNLFNKST